MSETLAVTRPLEFHQAGQHDQSTHGRGRSKPKAGVKNTSIVARDPHPKVTASDSNPIAPGGDNTAAVRAYRGQKGDEPERRVPRAGETVDLYRDLGRGQEHRRGFPDNDAFSVRLASGKDGNNTNLVQASTVGVRLSTGRPAWAGAAKRDAEVEGKRGVHGFVRGEVVEYLTPSQGAAAVIGPAWQKVTYYPGTQDFFRPSDRARWTGAEEVVLTKGEFYAKNPTFALDAPPAPISPIERRIGISASASGADPIHGFDDGSFPTEEFHGNHDQKSHGRRGSRGFSVADADWQRGPAGFDVGVTKHTTPGGRTINVLMDDAFRDRYLSIPGATELYEGSVNDLAALVDKYQPDDMPPYAMGPQATTLAILKGAEMEGMRIDPRMALATTEDLYAPGTLGHVVGISRGLGQGNQSFAYGVHPDLMVPGSYAHDPDPSDSWANPGVSTLSVEDTVRYTVTHEFGHALLNDKSAGIPSPFRNVARRHESYSYGVDPWPESLGDYAKSDPHELAAESFAIREFGFETTPGELDPILSDWAVEA